MTYKKYPVIEFWRSRIEPRRQVYWRYVKHNGKRYTPDFGTPSELAALLSKTRDRYGTPRRTTRQGIGGVIVVLEFRTRQVFQLKPGAWSYAANSEIRGERGSNGGNAVVSGNS